MLGLNTYSKLHRDKKWTNVKIMQTRNFYIDKEGNNLRLLIPN